MLFRQIVQHLSPELGTSSDVRTEEEAKVLVQVRLTDRQTKGDFIPVRLSLSLRKQVSKIS